jgi:hypothetical protein
MSRTPPQGRISQEAVFASITDLVRISLAGGNIRINALTTHLVIRRRLAHGATP